MKNASLKPNLHQTTLDTNELAEAGWFRRDEITLEDDTISLTREIICRFKDGLV